MTVRDLTRALTTAEYIDWIAFYAMEAEAADKANREARRRR